MSTRLSYVDRLNDGRQRRPSSALDDITQTLSRLEQHLGRAIDNRDSEDVIAQRLKKLADEAASESNGPVRVSASAAARDPHLSPLERLSRDPLFARRQDEPQSSVNSLARELGNLRSDLHTIINSGMREEFSHLRHELSDLLAAVPHSRGTEGLEAGLARIARSVAELSERDDRDTHLLQMELGRLKAAIDELLHAEQVRTAQAPLSSDFDALQARLDQVAATIDHIPDLRSVRMLDERMQQLAHALEQLALRSQGDQQHLVTAIDERLDEISRAIAASAALARSSGINPAVLERIEARIGSLARQVDELNDDPTSDTIIEHLIGLSTRVDDLAQKVEVPAQSLERLAHYVQLISERMGSVSLAPETEQMLHGIEAQVSALSNAFTRHQADVLQHGTSLFHDLEQKLVDVVTRLSSTSASASDSTLMAMIDDRFSDLARRMDDVRALGDERTYQALEARLENMANKLYAVTSNGGDPRLLRKLESQVSHLSSLLSQPHQDLAGLARLTPRLEQIERAMTENRASLIDAARQAAEEALQKFAVSQRSEPMDARLQDELQKLEVLTRQTAERNSKTFEAIHDTLVKIVSRLGTLEAEGKSLEGDTPNTFPPFSEPEPVFAQQPVFEETGALFGEKAATDGSLETVKSRFRSLSEAFRRRRKPQQEEQAAIEPSLAGLANDRHEQKEPISDINTILRRVTADRPSFGVRSPDAGKADFIAAARRAATAEAGEPEAFDDETGEPRRRRSISTIVGKHRKHAMVALGGVILLAAGMHWASTLSMGPASPLMDIAKDAPAEPKAVTKQIAAAKKPDPIQTGSIKPASASRKANAEERIIPQHAFAAPDTKIEAAPATAAAKAADAFVPTEADLPAELQVQALREAALQGDAIAYFEIANRLAEGRGMPRNIESAATWYERAADKGLALAQYRIGNMYEKGIGVERDLTKAKTWYKAAAMQGNLTAMHNLGVLYAMGADNDADHRAAVRWFTEAADFDVTDSQFNLAILAAKGLGMQKDMTEAYKWLDIVARKGDTDAASKRDDLARAMEPDQLKIAEGKAKLWKARNVDAAANTVAVPVEWNEPQISSASPEYKQALTNIQHLLNRMGYDAGVPDGIMGAKTRNAIKAFQSKHGLTPSGEIDQDLVKKLLEQNETA